MTSTDTGERWAALADRWRSERAERQARRHLEQADFDALREAGYLTLIVPEEQGGSWHDRASSARTVCDALRALGAGDPAVALVAAMHPSVISFWLLNPDPSQPDWEDQRRAVFASAVAGEQWGTITSEPGSGGDISRTRATARPASFEPFLLGRGYEVSGDKHFGSGSGIADRMVTTAVPTGEDEPAMFVLDTTDHAWDGTSGMTLTHEWDGVGMAATQSHAMRLERAPAVRMAYDGPLSIISAGAGALVATTFTAVILGVLDEAGGFDVSFSHLADWDLWLRLLATVLGAPIGRPAGPDGREAEAGAAEGAAWLAWRGLGHAPPREPRAATWFEPDPAQEGALTEAYARYVALGPG